MMKLPIQDEMGSQSDIMVYVMHILLKAIAKEKNDLNFKIGS